MNQLSALVVNFSNEIAIQVVAVVTRNANWESKKLFHSTQTLNLSLLWTGKIENWWKKETEMGVREEEEDDDDENTTVSTTKERTNERHWRSYASAGIAQLRRPAQSPVCFPLPFPFVRSFVGAQRMQWVSALRCRRRFSTQSLPLQPPQCSVF